MARGAQASSDVGFPLFLPDAGNLKISQTHVIMVNNSFNKEEEFIYKEGYMPRSVKNSKSLAVVKTLITYVILALLVALPGVAFCNPLSDAQAEAEAAAIIRDMNIVSGAYNKYYAQYGKMPLLIADLTSSGILKTDYNNVTYLDNAAGFDSTPDAIDAGNGIQWATIINSGINNKSTAVCKMINVKMLGLAPDAAIPEVTWTDVKGVHKFDAIPAEIKKKKLYCIKNGISYDVIQIITLNPK